MKHTGKSTRRRRKETRKGWGRIVLRGMILAGGTLLILFAFFVFMVWAGVFGPLPDGAELASIRHNTASEVYSADGVLLGRYYLENRLTVGNREISPHVIHALVATEDARFFEHHGIDYTALARVLVRTILLGDRRQGGGSTLSEQLARNLYPRRGTGWGALLVNKVREAFIAARLEKVYDKEEILMLYLNTVPFGEDLYGIETAARRFFSKPAADLNPAEAATLVGMLAANTAYNPRLHPGRALRRRNVVLSRMGRHGFLTPAEVERWQRSPLALRYHRLDRNGGPAPYFLDHLRGVVQQLLEATGRDDLPDLLTGGLRIETTLRADLQRVAVKVVRERMDRLQREFDAHWHGSHPGDESSPFFLAAFRSSHRYRSLKKEGLDEEAILQRFRQLVAGRQGQRYRPLDSLWREVMTLHAALVVLAPRDGYVLAWVGDRDHRRWQYDHVLAHRQVGSTFKPFVYVTALEEGMSPCDLFPNERKIYADGWSPANADGHYGGYYTLKGALAHSVNTVTAEVADRVGIARVAATARRLGISEPLPEVPSLALGSATLSPLVLATAYAPFLNGGKRITPVMVIRITDRQGRVLYEHRPGDLPEVLDRKTAREVLGMLCEVVDSGTARSLRTHWHLTGDIAGKTGTTQEHADGWFIGLLPHMVTAVWVGAESPAIHFRTLTAGQGAHTALPLFAGMVSRGRRNTTLRSLMGGTFPALTPEMTAALDCPDYLEELPEHHFLRDLFGRKAAKNDSLHRARERERALRREERRKKIRDAMRRIFGGK